MAFENLKKNGIKILLRLIKRDFLQKADAVKTVNNTEADENGNIPINTVPYAQNLETEFAQRTIDDYTIRTAGGAASIDDGDAWVISVKGNNVHEGYVEESLVMDVLPVDPDTQGAISATVNQAEFVAACSNVSGTYTFSYTDSWDTDPSAYGIAVTGTPADGDQIVVVFVAEERGTIYPANPNGIIATGWNLFNYANGYARVLKYSEDPYEDFGISGTYTSLAFSETLEGEQSAITVSDGRFTVPSDGFVWVTGGNDTDTAIWMTWDDWAEGYEGDFEGYTEHEVDFANEMTSYFPYGLLKAGSIVDEINLNIGQAISRVERLEYSAANLAVAIATGREYEYDEDYIYLERETPITNTITVSGAITVDDHGMELVSQTDVPATVEMLYGTNLKNKLERNVLTISQQTLSAEQQKQVRDNLGVTDILNGAIIVENKLIFDNLTIAAGSYSESTYSVAKTGYVPLGVIGFNVGNASSSGAGRTHAGFNKLYVSNGSLTVCVRNMTGSSAIKIRLYAFILYKKSGVFA